jgi:ferrous iron transport protein A
MPGKIIPEETNLGLMEMLPGDTAEVISFGPHEPSYCHRLLAMGLIPGTLFTFIRKAPLGDPLEIFFRGFHLSIRKKDARLIKIKPVKTKRA